MDCGPSSTHLDDGSFVLWRSFDCVSVAYNYSIRCVQLHNTLIIEYRQEIYLPIFELTQIFKVVPLHLL